MIGTLSLPTIAVTFLTGLFFLHKAVEKVPTSDARIGTLFLLIVCFCLFGASIPVIYSWLAASAFQLLLRRRLGSVSEAAVACSSAIFVVLGVVLSDEVFVRVVNTHSETVAAFRGPLIAIGYLLMGGCAGILTAFGLFKMSTSRVLMVAIPSCLALFSYACYRLPWDDSIYNPYDSSRGPLSQQELRLAMAVAVHVSERWSPAHLPQVVLCTHLAW